MAASRMTHGTTTMQFAALNKAYNHMRIRVYTVTYAIVYNTLYMSGDYQ